MNYVWSLIVGWYRAVRNYRSFTGFNFDPSPDVNATLDSPRPPGQATQKKE